MRGLWHFSLGIWFTACSSPLHVLHRNMLLSTQRALLSKISQGAARICSPLNLLNSSTDLTVLTWSHQSHGRRFQVKTWMYLLPSLWKNMRQQFRIVFKLCSQLSLEEYRQKLLHSTSNNFQYPHSSKKKAGGKTKYRVRHTLLAISNTHIYQIEWQVAKHKHNRENAAIARGL